MSAEDKQHKLDQIRADIIKHNVCSNLAQSATQLVMGDGNPDADIVFIGEAPGADEDRQGLPFVGRSGQFLNDMLQLINFRRSDIYITNIVKYRPPHNRDPEESEKSAFLPYLYRQLSVIEPRLVVTLGRHAMNVFLPQYRISQVHGRAFRKRFPDIAEQAENGAEVTVNTLVLLPLYHPAAALYNGSMRETLEADFKQIPKILKKL